MEEDSIFDILDLRPAMNNINVTFNLTNDLDPAAGNFSEFIFPPEKEGSPYLECASIVWKSDLKVKFPLSPKNVKFHLQVYK